MAEEAKKEKGGIVVMLSLAAAISFVVGYVISVIGGIWWPANDGILIALVVMGVLVGFFNITGREVVPYLVAAIALILIGTANPSPFDPLKDVNESLVENLNDVIKLMAIFTAPAALIQAIRAGVALAKPGD